MTPRPPQGDTTSATTTNNNGEGVVSEKTAPRATNNKNGNHKMSSDSSFMLTREESDMAINKFCTFLKFPTVSNIAVETGAYVQCANWLLQQCQLVCDKAWFLPEAPKHSPVVVAKWSGVNPNWPVLLLNSHYDVVPADESNWTFPPFDAVRENGRIYGRGTQDMKCVCIQYLEAITKIKKLDPNWKPKRDIYLTFVPDEEVGGGGMAAFLDSETYRNLPGIALALDEGLASTDDTYSVFYGERLPWWVNVTATGPTGHGSRFIEHTAVEQLLALTQKALEFRQGQRKLLFGHDDKQHTENCAHVVAAKNQKKTTPNTKTLGDVTTLNITTLQAGVQVGNTYAYNCVPPKAQCSFDIRISPHVQPSEIGSMLDQWCQECSSTSNNDPPTLSWKFIDEAGGGLQKHALTSTDNKQNPWYRVFAEALENDLGVKCVPQVFPAATDSRFLRALGIRALGFSPMRNTEILLHEDNEYLSESVFLEGVAVYVHLIVTLGSQGPEMDAN